MSKEVIRALFPQGTVRVHSEHQINTHQGREEIAEKTRTLNDSRFLNSKFFNSDSPQVLTTIEAPREQGLVSVIDPLGQYYPDSVMIMAATPHMMEDETVGTYHVYDMPVEMQRLYWAIVRETLRFNPGARYVENAAITYSNEQYRTPRTIGLPHGQIGQIGAELVQPTRDGESLDTPESQREIEALRNDPRAKQALVDINKILKKSLLSGRGFGRGFRVYPRNDMDTLPLGYSLAIPGNPTDPNFTFIMETNHRAYEEVMKDLFEEISPDESSGAVPQPSYRLYVEEIDPVNHQGTIITLSPMIFWHGGVNEAGGMLMDRAPHYDDFTSAQERSDFLTKHTKHMKEKFTSVTTKGLK